MKKIIQCTECGQDSQPDYFCDTCGENLVTKFHGIPITISFGYGSNLDGEEYHFCEYKCLLRFIIEELKKEKKDESRNER